MTIGCFPSTTSTPERILFRFTSPSPLRGLRLVNRSHPRPLSFRSSVALFRRSLTILNFRTNEAELHRIVIFLRHPCFRVRHRHSSHLTTCRSGLRRGRLY